MSRRLAAALAACLALSLPAISGAAKPSASLPDIEDEVMCPICGTTLEQSGSPQADRERELIRRLIATGKDKEEIKDVLVAEYGPDVLAEPEGSGFDLTAWLIPVLGLLIALGSVAVILRRSSRTRRPQNDSAPPPNSAEVERLERDMSSYDL